MGRVLGRWGVDGELKVEPLTDFAERFAPGASLWLGDRLVRVLASRTHKAAVLLRVTGVGDADAAEALRGSLIEVAEDELPELPPDTYYRYQLIGLEVRTTAGESLGRVVEVLDTGSNEVLVARRTPDDAAGEVLIPAIDDVVRAIDLAAGAVTIELIEGLLPEPPKPRVSRGRRRRPAAE